MALLLNRFPLRNLLLLPFVSMVLSFPAGAQDLAASWNQQMMEALTASHKLVDDIDSNLGRLERELAEQQEKIRADSGCLDFDCEALRKMAEISEKAEAAAQNSILLGHIALEQRQRLADNTRNVVSAIRKGKDHLAFTLWAQEIAKGASDLSIGIAVSLATGDPTELAGTIRKVAATSLNFATNKAVESRAQIGAGYANLAAEAGINKLGQDIAGSLAGNLTRTGLFEVVTGKGGVTKFGIRPRFLAQDLVNSKALRGDYFKRLKNLPGVVDIAARTITTALTSGAINQTKEYLAAAKRELDASIGAQRGYVMTVVFQKLHLEELRRVRLRFLATKSRADRLRAKCRKLALGKSCGEGLAAAIGKADADRKKDVAAATVRRQAAAQALINARDHWKKLLDDVNKIHQELRHARDGVAETEFLERSRATIERLAVGAASADVRDKYRKQLNDLKARKPLADQKRETRSLEKQRKDLWERIENQRARISRLSQDALTAYSETAETIDRAERAYFVAVSAARSKSLDCLGQTDETVQAKAKGLKKLRQETGNLSLVPQEIYAPISGALTGLSKEVASLKIGSITRQSDNCRKIAASGLGGCWFDVSRGDDANRSKPVTIRESGNRLTVDYKSVNRLYAGTIEGDVIKLSYRISGPAELAKFRWGQDGGKPPPMKVLRQVYPKYSVSRSTLKRSGDNNVLSGHSHGAYVTWGKESLKLSSFTPRDYPEKLVRDHRLKIRSIAFAGADGQRRQSQSAGDKLFAVAKGSSGCAHAVDTVRVKSYVNNDSGHFVWDILRETGPATLEFRSELPALRAMVNAMPADQVKSITLFDPKALRGSTLKISSK